ncbi:alpha/beta fold hydrolase [Bifidobacterium callimiconis]|uniref:Alpha/beta hydrolase n=1 Tax=Bifidobacterium callimiconis TaxID=2306973 RepID=A0A430F9N8_9BIFI|nr:alpha/beta hydrolase [Bifidobacterium callimiconis]RSX49522.1 alpha/beta hydrolase [Bifidobacterium callimiconis]
MSSSTTYAVLVHGWGGSPKAWDTVRFPATWTTFAYTLPGHGDRAQEGPWTIRETAEDLADYVRSVVPAGVKPLIIAHSMGGQLSMLLNAEHPELVSGEVVIDPAYNGGDSPEELAETHRNLAELHCDPHAMMREFVKGAFGPYLNNDARRVILDDIERTNGQALVDYFASEYLDPGAFGLKRDTPNVAKRRTRPVLGFYMTDARGNAERECNPEGLDVSISLWKEAGHRHFMHMEDPERFSREVVEWAVQHGLADAGDLLSAPVETAAVRA